MAGQAYQPVQPIDIPGLFSTIANLRMSKLAQQQGQLQLADMYEARDRRHQIQAALQAGDMQKYAALDPHGYAAMLKSGLEAGKAQAEIANTQSQIQDRSRQAEETKQKNTMAYQANIAKALEANPQAAPVLQEHINRLAAARHINHFAIPGMHQADPEDPESQAEAPGQGDIRTMQALAGVEDPYAKPTSDQIEYRQAQAQGYRGSLQDWILTQKRAAASQINVGDKSGATMANRTKWNQDIAAGEQTLAAIDDLKAISNRGRFLTYGGRLKGWKLGQMASIDPAMLTPEEKQYISDKRAFAETLDQAFNAYRLEVTGAGASVGELRMLMDSMLNKNLNPIEFESSLKRFEKITRRGVEAKKRLLRDKVSLAPEDMDARLSVEMGRMAHEERMGTSKSVTPDQAAQEFDSMTGGSP